MAKSEKITPESIQKDRQNQSNPKDKVEEQEKEATKSESKKDNKSKNKNKSKDAEKEVSPKESKAKVPAKQNVNEIVVERSNRTKENLDKQEKVKVLIPFEPGEKAGATFEVGINGYLMKFPKGKMFSAPKSVAQIIEASLDETMLADQAFRIDRDPEVEKALS